MAQPPAPRPSSQPVSIEVNYLTAAKFFFFISGATALVYEVVWLRLLGLVFGNTTHAVSTVLAAYMAGLGVGSFVIGRYCEKWKNPLRVYGFLEVGIGLYAAATPLIVKLIQAIYVGAVRPDSPNDAGALALKFFLSFAVVFIPTFLMGGTLPVLARFFLRDGHSAGSVTSLLYGLNTFGAMLGTLAAGFWILPALGLSGTLWACVFLNIGIGAAALGFSGKPGVSLTASEAQTVPSARPSLLAYALPIGLFISGFNAMLYEIGWTRILAMVLSSSTYAFTLMLASFLVGIALGSWLVRRAGLLEKPQGIVWGYLQLILAAVTLLTLPVFPWVGLGVVRLYGLTIGHPGLLMLAMSVVCFILMAVPSICFGAIFPLSTALFIRQPGQASSKIGTLYLWNTAGNIAGSIAAGFWLIPALGIHQTILIAIGVGAVLSGISAWAVQKRPLQNALLFLTSAAVLLGAGDAAVKGWDKRLLSAGLNINTPLFVDQKSETILSKLLNHHLLYYREGLNSIVSVGLERDNIYLKVNGKTDASTQGDTATQILLGHLPHLFHPAPDRSLIIGYGSGMTLAAALAHPVKNADCAEIEPAVMETSKFFESVNRGADKDPRVRIIQNDGRNHLMMEKNPYDVIVSEPSNPWMAGVSYLFTVDFYKQVDQRLKPGGVFCQWIHAYAIRPEDFWMVAASIREVFPHVTLWRASAEDYLIIAQREPFVFDLDRVEARLAQSEQVRKDLKAVGMTGAASLLARFQMGETSIAKYADQAGINDDNFLPLEFSTPYSLYDSTMALRNDLALVARSEPLPEIRSAGVPWYEKPQHMIDLGNGYLEMNEPARAEEVFRRAGEDPQALTGLARCLAFKGQDLRSTEMFEKAATAEAFDYLARYHLKQGDIEKALENSEKSLALDSSNWQAHYWKAQSLEKMGKWSEAIQAYDSALQAGSPSLGLRLPRAAAMRRAGRLDEAIQELEELGRKYPTDPPVFTELKSAYLEKGDLENPIRHYEALVKANPYFEPHWIDLIGLYLKKNDNENVAWATSQAQEFLN